MQDSTDVIWILTNSKMLFFKTFYLFYFSLKASWKPYCEFDVHE